MFNITFYTHSPVMFYMIFWYKNMKLWNIIKSQPKRAVCGYQKVNRITKKHEHDTTFSQQLLENLCRARHGALFNNALN